ncbi:hypothetical protein BKA93DRAFT_595271 [Sparassis latifolia]
MACPTAELCRLLKRTPHLTRLVLENTCNAQVFTLPATALKHLRSIDGPPELLLKLVPGRPVEILHLQLGFSRDVQTAHSVLNSLKQSTADITTLSISYYTFAQAQQTFKEYVPRLRILSLHFGPDLTMQQIPILCHQWAGIPPLRSLHLIFFSNPVYGHSPLDFNLPKQHKLIRSHLADVAPTATCMSFGMLIRWHRIELVGGDCSWIPKLKCPREMMKRKLVLGAELWDRVYVQDFNGFFEGLFAANEMTPSLEWMFRGPVDEGQDL